MSADVPDTGLQRREIRSYVVRGGRLTSAQQRAREAYWPRYGLDFSPAPLNLDALFGRVAPRTLEIGFGNGEHLATLAAADPEQDFLGVEVHPPGVGHLLLRAAAVPLRNLRVVQHDVVEVLREQIAPESLNRVLVLFPDPWHKKRHHKRRLINPAFADLVASRLRPGGRLHLATDWAPYAQWMLEVLNAVPALRNCATEGGYALRDQSRPTTRFELRGERLGHAVHELWFERISPTNCACAESPAPHQQP
jgi:tRNA (guanine-N7-)-methyltransferase